MNEAQIAHLQQLAARRKAVLHRVHMARYLANRARQLEHDAMRDLHELEVAIKVLRTTASGSADLGLQEFEQVYNSLVNEAQEAAATATAAVSTDLADLELFNPDHAARITASPRSSTIAGHCISMLMDGSWKTTEELYNGLRERGIIFSAANPTQRLSQILSADDRFKTQRGRGWALNAIIPGAHDAPPWPTEQSRVDAEMRRRARQLAERDNR